MLFVEPRSQLFCILIVPGMGGEVSANGKRSNESALIRRELTERKGKSGGSTVFWGKRGGSVCMEFECEKSALLFDRFTKLIFL